MNEPIDELYLKWLYSLIGDVELKSPSRTYWSLVRQLFKTEFVWVVPNDDNRVEDGRDLRYVFVDVTGVDPDDKWWSLGCSFLEMFVALSHHLEFEDGRRKANKWFWRLMDNLDLEVYNDKNYTDESFSAINEILERVNFRQYQPDGSGGMFPLEYPTKDQREVEIWYQLNAYLLEHE